MRPKLRDKSLTFLLLLILVFVLSQIVLAQNASSFQVKDSYIEIQKSSYPQNIALVRKENGKEEIAGQVKIVDQYLISDIPENEFLDEYSYLKEGFQDLSVSLETDEPLFDKENFHHSVSLWDKTKSFLGLETLPEYRITKEVDKFQSIQTTLNLSTLTFDTNYKKTEEGYIKQTLTFKNNTNQDLNLDLNLKHIINAEKIIWNKEEYEITQTPRSFDPEIEASVSFNPSGASYLAIYDFIDTLSFDPQLWVFKKDSQNIVLLQLLVKVPANSSIIIDPWYGFVGDKKYAWGENIGWLNFYPTHGKVYVATDCLKGYVWAENIGWINFGDGTPGAASDCDSGVHYANDSASDFGVNNDGDGKLYGYAWGENIGWINFHPTHSQVEIDSSGKFSDYAWAENVGWINFGHTQSDYVPQTEWTPPPSLTFTIDSNTKNLGDITPGTSITKTTTTTVTTSDPNGYSLKVSDSVSGSNSALLHTDTTTRITDYSGTIAEPTFWSGTGLGISVYAADTGKEEKWGTGTTEADENNKYAGIPETDTEIHNVSTNVTDDTTSIGYKLDVPNTQKTGSYSGTIIYTVVVNIP